MRPTGEDTEILFGPDMWLGAYVEKELGKRMHVWDGECHVHAGIRPADIEATRAAHPGADFLIHPECGCTTSVMEYVAAGDVVGRGRAHALDRRDAQIRRGAGARRGRGGRERCRPGDGGVCRQRRSSGQARQAVVATEIGMLHPLRMAAPDVEFIPANPRRAAST